MTYTITEKKEQLAPTVLYGANAKRYGLELQHVHANGHPDNMTSTLYVDKEIFAKYGIGDKIHIAIEPLGNDTDTVNKIAASLEMDGIAQTAPFDGTVKDFLEARRPSDVA